jgi:stalled ribosome alternative rescue factor ArfA
MTGSSSASSNVSKRNPLAREVKTRLYCLRVVKSRKGKGSYSRKKVKL